VIRGQSVIAAAGDVIASLNETSQAVQDVRVDADSEIAVSVNRINSLLEEFAVVNKQVVDGTHLHADTTDALDARDRILADLSKEIGIKSVARGGNDIAIYTDSGVTLFDQTAKSVTFEPKTLYSASEPGNSVIIDGVAVTGNAAMMPIHSGRLKGLTEVRDEITVTYQTQLDEIARGLITVFSESDQTGSATPLADTTGLFSYAGSPAVPPAGTAIVGLAQQIKINPQFDPSVGGDPVVLRDGGTWGDEYVYNDPSTTGAVGYTGRLSELLGRFDVGTSFDVSAQIGGNATLMNYASTSVGWLQEMRQSAASSKEYSTAVLERATDSLVAVTAVNLDYEMTVMLDLEHSFQATSRLIAAIDAMYASLLQAA
jgi:flagellar hook-associated protein 1